MHCKLGQLPRNVLHLWLESIAQKVIWNDPCRIFSLTMIMPFERVLPEGRLLARKLLPICYGAQATLHPKGKPGH
jgi:hypothetical protein